jgi:hypothetical protein
VQDALVARIQKIFRFFNFEKILQQLHKAPRVPRSAFRYLSGIRGNGTDRRNHNTEVHERNEILPSTYLKEPRREEIYRKYFERSSKGIYAALEVGAFCDHGAQGFAEFKTRSIMAGILLAGDSAGWLRYSLHPLSL